MNTSTSLLIYVSSQSIKMYHPIFVKPRQSDICDSVKTASLPTNMAALPAQTQSNPSYLHIYLRCSEAIKLLLCVSSFLMCRCCNGQLYTVMSRSIYKSRYWRHCAPLLFHAGFNVFTYTQKIISWATCIHRTSVHCLSPIYLPIIGHREI